MGKKNVGYQESLSGGIKIRQLIKPRTKGQKEYWEALNKYTITLGIGPAGSGKTYLAIAAALQSLQRQEIERIIITRPVIESGENLGFLPGDIAEKMNPYIKPIEDSVVDLVGGRSAKVLFEYTIEICPLAYMRGRTFKNSFIIADEMSSSSPSQMKNLLTRLGEGSQLVILGDPNQSDIPNRLNGLEDLIQRVKRYGSKPNGFKAIYMSSEDIIRHPLIPIILELYEEKSYHEEYSIAAIG